MGGPEAAIVLRQDPSPARALHHVLVAADQLGFSLDEAANADASNTPRVAGWTSLVELRDLEGNPIGVSLVRADAARDLHDLRKIAEGAGFMPRASINLAAYTNSKAAHRSLGRLALAVAEQTGGLIDMEGAIVPPFDSARHRPPEIPGMPWNPPFDEIRAHLSSIPGDIIEVEYSLGGDRTWVLHVVDVVFLRAWLDHPDFHMIK